MYVPSFSTRHRLFQRARSTSYTQATLFQPDSFFLNAFPRKVSSGADYMSREGKRVSKQPETMPFTIFKSVSPPFQRSSHVAKHSVSSRDNNITTPCERGRTLHIRCTASFCVPSSYFCPRAGRDGQLSLLSCRVVSYSIILCYDVECQVT